jgi:hypothetical protein
MPAGRQRLVPSIKINRSNKDRSPLTFGNADPANWSSFFNRADLSKLLRMRCAARNSIAYREAVNAAYTASSYVELPLEMIKIQK